MKKELHYARQSSTTHVIASTAQKKMPPLIFVTSFLK